MSTTINNDESPEELVDKVIDQDSLKDKVNIFMMIMINFCNRKKMSPGWIESMIFRVSERTSETIIQVLNPPHKHNIRNFPQRELYSPLEQQTREFLFLLNKKDRELYSYIFSTYEKKRKKEDIRNYIIVGVIIIVLIIILFSF